ncbi:MAG: hypothetical protein IIB83_05230 [Bacteroidetes bacterium]|nr:hypothetical protein [Bacteroidota bacterium]
MRTSSKIIKIVFLALLLLVVATGFRLFTGKLIDTDKSTAKNTGLLSGLFDTHKAYADVPSGDCDCCCDDSCDS